MIRQRTGALLAVGALLCGGCTSGSTAPPLAAAVEQFREDEVAGQIQLRLRNNGGTDVPVDAVGLQWPGLAESASEPKAATLRPGIAADLPLPLPGAVCGELPPLSEPMPAPPTEPATAVVTSGDEQFRVAIDDAAGVLDRIWLADCRQQRAAQQVRVEFGSEWERVDPAAGGPPVAQGELLVTPVTAAGAVDVIEVRGTVIALLSTVSPLPASAQNPTRLAVRIGSNGRCTGHVLGEAKKPFDFAVLLRIDGVETVVTPVRPAEADQLLLRAVVEDGCAVIAPNG